MVVNTNGIALVGTKATQFPYILPLSNTLSLYSNDVLLLSLLALPFDSVKLGRRSHLGLDKSSSSIELFVLLEGLSTCYASVGSWTPTKIGVSLSLTSGGTVGSAMGGDLVTSIQ